MTKVGNNSHVRALEIINLGKDLDTARAAAVSKNKNAVIAALRNVFFAAVNDLPNSTAVKLNGLCIEQGVEQLRDLHRNNHASYTHNQSVEEFQPSLAKVLEDRLVDRIRKSELFSIMIDESTDISVHQNLLVYIRILEENSGRWIPKSYFLAVRQMSQANADAITGEVLQVLREKGLDTSKFVGMATDGAAHMASLERIQTVLDGVGHSRFKQVFHTRWLSFEGSVHALVRNYSAMLSVFLEENSAKSLSLHKPVSNYKFLYCAHFLSDVLKHLSVLKDLRDSKSGPVLKEFLAAVPSEPVLGDDDTCQFEFKGHTIRDSVGQRNGAVSACDQFCHSHC
ncbi:uncharacterized protein [Argopecten irradians]|uniref:uncharacterized protein n=1 Tax=Argopecten irradians TaxID=31199 RepID=UPI00371D7FEC